ncbi:hypothetical protein HUJ04_009878 [Dendroctonus ponderosae]|nr:hypothetical protein HUJ04_009878 [Dendroctonus ponderosae]
MHYAVLLTILTQVFQGNDSWQGNDTDQITKCPELCALSGQTNINREINISAAVIARLKIEKFTLQPVQSTRLNYESISLPMLNLSANYLQPKPHLDNPYIDLQSINIEETKQIANELKNQKIHLQELTTPLEVTRKTKSNMDPHPVMIRYREVTSVNQVSIVNRLQNVGYGSLAIPEIYVATNFKSTLWNRYFIHFLCEAVSKIFRHYLSYNHIRVVRQLPHTHILSQQQSAQKFN